jgi:hypothetical protein
MWLRSAALFLVTFCSTLRQSREGISDPYFTLAGGEMKGQLRLKCAVAALFLIVMFLPGAAQAYKGLAGGKVGLIDTNSKGYGFSAYSGAWASVDLDSPADCRLTGTYLGYLRTPARIYAYNPTNDRWFYGSYQGIPMGESVQGATAIFWSTTGTYAIASLWTIWRCQTFEPRDGPVGGGSAGNFALLWTKNKAYAFNSSSGLWMSQTLDGNPEGGITCDGIGLVWTALSAYAFDPTPGGWVPLNLGSPSGVSACGGGKVALVWGVNTAQAYSGLMDTWYPVNTTTAIEGGRAGGDVALLWDSSRAYSFDANTGSWSTLVLQGSNDMRRFPEGVGGDTFWIGPNPNSTGSVAMHLPVGQDWKVEIFNVNGACLRSALLLATQDGASWIWDGADESGLAVAAGTYWVRASAQDQVEVRRIVLTR